MQMSCTCTVAYVRVKSTASKKLVIFKLQYKMWQRRFYFICPIYFKKRSPVVTAFTLCTLLYSFCVICTSVLYSLYIQVNNTELPCFFPTL